MSLQTIALLLVVAMVPFATLNPILYGVFFPWRQSREGRAMITLFTGFGLLVDFSIIYEVVPWFPGKWVVAIVVYAGILAGMAWLSYALVRLLPLCVNRRERASAPRVP